MEETFRFENRNQYLEALDRVILKNDIQTRDIGSGSHRYFPVPIKEAIADYVFHYWNTIDEKFMVMDGMLVCTVKVVFMPSYPGAQEVYCVGSAAVLIHEKVKNSLEYQLPAVASEATAKALGKLGNIFGRNLSRVLNKKTQIADNFSLRKKRVDPETKVDSVKIPEPETEPEKKIEPEKKEVNIKDLPF